MPRTPVAEKEEFIKECRKLITAALILEIYLYNKNTLLNASNICDKTNFTITIKLRHTISTSYNSRCTVSCSYTELATRSSWDKTIISNTRFIYVSHTVLSVVVDKLFDSKPKGFIKRIPEERFIFTQSTCKDEEFEWAKYVLTSAGINLETFKLNKYRYNLGIKRSYTATVNDKHEEPIWAESLEEAQTMQQKLIAEGNKLGVGSFYYWKDKSVDKTSESVLEALPIVRI